MESLERTSTALYELRATNLDGVGFHMTNEVRVGKQGLTLGDIDFNPAKHKPHMKKTFSLRGEATGVDQVPQEIPIEAMDLNIVLDNSPSNDDRRVARAKSFIMDLLVEAFEGSVTNEDDIYKYVIGTGSSAAMDDLTYEPIEFDQDKDVLSAEISEICLSGLTVIVSDFMRFPIVNRSGFDFRRTIGLMVQHPVEVKMPEGLGIWSLGKTEEVNTDNPDELSEYNEALSQKNANRENRLEQAGIKVVKAQLSVLPGGRFGFDVNGVDEQIARAVGEFAQAA